MDNIYDTITFQDQLNQFCVCKQSLLNVDKPALRTFTENAPVYNYNYVEGSLIDACSKGDVKLAEWILSMKHDLKTSAEFEEAYLLSCCRGQLNVSRWLLSVNTKMNTCVVAQAAFRYACHGGSLEMAQWLLSMKPDIDIFANDHNAFRGACVLGHLAVAKWLCDMNPDVYYVVLDAENGMYICEWGVWPLLPIHPTTVSLQNIKEETRTCLVCQEKRAELQSQCKHNYCVECIRTWMSKSNNSCPYCRSDLVEFIKIAA